MKYNVLVLCQRKNVVDVDENIKHLIQTCLNPDSNADVHVEHVSEDMDAVVDYTGNFGDNEWTQRVFQTKNYYDLIICNTCPFVMMNYPIIRSYIKENGFLAITAYNINNPKSKLNTMPMYTNFLMPEIANFGFHRVPLDEDGGPPNFSHNTALFQKSRGVGEGNKRKTRNIRRRKTKRTKSRRTK